MRGSMPLFRVGEPSTKPLDSRISVIASLRWVTCRSISLYSTPTSCSPSQTALAIVRVDSHMVS